MCIMSLFDCCGGGGGDDGDSVTKVMMAYGVSDCSAVLTVGWGHHQGVALL